MKFRCPWCSGDAELVNLDITIVYDGIIPAHCPECEGDFGVTVLISGNQPNYNKRNEHNG